MTMINEKWPQLKVVQYNQCELVLFGCPCVMLRFEIDRSHRTSFIVPSGKYRLVCSHVLLIRGL